MFYCFYCVPLWEPLMKSRIIKAIINKRHYFVAFLKSLMAFTPCIMTAAWNETSQIFYIIIFHHLKLLFTGFVDIFSCAVRWWEINWCTARTSMNKWLIKLVLRGIFHIISEDTIPCYCNVGVIILWPFYYTLPSPYFSLVFTGNTVILFAWLSNKKVLFCTKIIIYLLIHFSLCYVICLLFQFHQN